MESGISAVPCTMLLMEKVLTTQSRNFLDNLIVAQPVKKFLSFYRTQRFILPVKKFPIFTELTGSLPCLPAPVTGTTDKMEITTPFLTCLCEMHSHKSFSNSVHSPD